MRKRPGWRKWTFRFSRMSPSRKKGLCMVLEQLIKCKLSQNEHWIRFFITLNFKCVFLVNSIFQYAGRSKASMDEPIHTNLYAIERKFNFRGHREAIFVKNWFRNVVYVHWSKKYRVKELDFLSSGCHFVIQGFLRKRKKIRAPKFSLV